MPAENGSKDNPLITISERDQEQIISVILTLAVPEGKRARLAANVELRGQCLCVRSLSRDGADDDLRWLSDVHKLPVKERPRTILVIDPTLRAAKQLDQARETWLKRLDRQRKKQKLDAILEIWGAHEIKQRVLALLPLALHFFPREVADGPARVDVIKATRTDYDRELRKLYGKIQFIGMSVYKEEATAAVDMQAIYIPLRLVGEAADESKLETPRTDPLRLLARGERHVILGDPGSGKSTLLRFLALVGTHRPLQERYKAPVDERLPIFILLRQFADALKANPDIDILDYVVAMISRDFGLRHLGREFFEYYLYAGQAILLFDGVDELPGLQFKQDVRERVGKFLERYPGNSALVTSRVVGYDEDIRYGDLVTSFLGRM